MAVYGSGFSKGAEKQKDSPEPPETVLRLSRLEEHVTGERIIDTSCRIIAGA
jgi:hypothetical protein